MKAEGKLSREQVTLLVFLCVLGNIVYIHTWIDDGAGRAAWIACLIGILLVSPFAVWLLYICKFYPNANVFDIIEAGLGKFITKVLCTVFILVNAAVAVAQLNMFTQMLRVNFLLLTPSRIIMIVIMLIGIIAINSGISAFARLVEILSFFGTLNYFIAFLFAYGKTFKVRNIIPVFDTSWTGFFLGIIFSLCAASEVLLFLMVLVKFIPEPFKNYKWVVNGIGIGAFIFSYAIMVIIGMMGADLAKRIAFGGVNASKLISVGRFISGLEVLVFGTYQYLAIGKVTVCLYSMWTCSKKVFGNTLPKFQLYISAFLIYIPSIWLNSYNRAYALSVFLAQYILLPFCVFIIFLSAISIKLKK